MVTQKYSVPWEEAVKGFFLHKRATRNLTTAKWYRSYTTKLRNWADPQGISLEDFTKRNLDAYLAYRSDEGRSATTLHHDALTACHFFEWCSKNDIVSRDPLAEYKVRNAPKTYKYLPTEDNVRGLLEAVLNFYDKSQNLTSARGHSAKNRTFHRDRSYAIELVKLDTACRIGEIMNFKVSDYGRTEKGRQLTVRQAKGRQPRVLPVSSSCAEAIDEWLKVRNRVMSNAPEAQDEGWLFMSETGGRGDEGNYLRGLKKVIRWAGLPEEMNNHSQRRFSITTSAKDENGGLLFAQQQAGHTDPKTTMIYVTLDSDYLRERHEKVAVVKGLLTSTRAVKRQRLV
ncbi:MAG: recombinase [Chthonomonadales bacterium]|nr:recombinase [Chthonomonadales bacterium]